MKLVNALIFCQLVLLALCSHDKQETSYGDWNYIVFAQQWPSAGCTAWKDENETNRCIFPIGLDSWTIHGAWPSDTSGGYPQFCNSSLKFNVTNIEALVPNLTLHWANIYEGTPQDDFWAHEWKKHGTCAAEDNVIRNEFGYFDTTLQLAQEYNITTALMSSGIVPSITKAYSATDFSSAVKDQFGVTPIIKCYFHAKTTQYLVIEIHLCLDRKLRQIECISKAPDNCPNEQDIYYMPMEVHFSNESKHRGEL